MRTLPRLRIIAAGICGILSFGFADTADVQEVKISQSGFLGLEMCQIVHGYQDSKYGGESEINRGTWERMLFQYVNNMEVNEYIRVNLAIECQMSFSFPYNIYASWEAKLPKFSFYPDRAEGTFAIGDPRQLRFEFGFGYFPYRINPDVKNLGEYLFRSGTYPLYVLNHFNRPYSRLLGFRTSFTVMEDLRIDALLTAATLVPPLGNGSLSFVADYNLLDCVDLGAGISFANYFSVDDKLTTPIGNNSTQYITESGDTLFYTFKGIKPTAKLAIDPKTFIPGDLFNRQDLRIYGEVCVSGWENYKNFGLPDTALDQYYAKRSDRTVYMVGVNFPSFFNLTNKLLNAMGMDVPLLPKLDLDVLSLEYEYLPNKYPNSTYFLNGQTLQPVPQPGLFPSIGSDKKVYPWYWTIYAKKTFLDRFSLIAMFARDHMKPIHNDPLYLFYEDVLERKGDWWWNVRLNVKY
ncbi:MAG: hypothetical protein JXA71_15625 [Chitinispirillaceae bacterium]|nr:hypothetical protein [Chitinispirillaceae bacterium]